jgi:hypothetical protein
VCREIPLHLKVQTVLAAQRAPRGSLHRDKALGVKLIIPLHIGARLRKPGDALTSPIRLSKLYNENFTLNRMECLIRV